MGEVGSKLSISDLKTLMGVPQDQDIAIVGINRDMADAILSGNNNKNRKINQATLDKFVGQYSRGEFFLSTDCIGFALVMLTPELANNLYPFGVMFNVCQQLDMDTGKKRSLVDNTMLSDSYDSRLKEPGRVNSIKIIQLVVRFIRGEKGCFRNVKYTQYQLSQIANYFADQLVACSDLGLFRRVKNIPPASYAAFFVAYLSGVDPKYMLQILDTIENKTFNGRSVISTFYERLLTENGGSVTSAKSRYCMTQYCIHALEEGITSSRIYANRFYYTYDGCDLIL